MLWDATVSCWFSVQNYRELVPVFSLCFSAGTFKEGAVIQIFHLFWFFLICLKIIVNQFFLLYMGIQEAEETNCHVDVPKGGLLVVTDIELW